VGEHLDGLAAEYDCGHLPSACDAITIRSHPWLASRRAIFRPLASHHTHRATLAVQIPIAEPAAWPTARAARDFVPWRFSDAAHLSAWLGRLTGVRKPAQERPLARVALLGSDSRLAGR
jgi:hypothetical protein